MSNFSATYSPEDNKLRLYSLHRLDDGLYQRVSNAGFRFAPKQDLFVAPMWTPAREDLLLELCGEIGDEDTSLVERAEVRADRFEDYGESRAREGDAAYAGVQNITEHIPLGQPILVGHHSERRARRDAERIEAGMRRAVNAWETSEYWTRRAKGALSHAKYKERPDVRHRRIKGLEAERRKYQKEIDNAHKFTKLWSRAGLTLEQAQAIAGYDRAYIREEGQERSVSLYSMLSVEAPDVEQVRQKALEAHARTIASYGRWVAHVDNRQAYERAMLGESGGIASDQFDIAVGGSVLVRGDWLVVLRVNKVKDRINSLTTKPPRVMSALSRWKVSIEEVKDYRAPDPAEAAAVTKAAKTPPLVNYPGEGFIEITSDEWKKRNDDCKSIRKVAATAEHGVYRVRRALVLSGSYALKQVFLTDAKRVDRPAPATVAPVELEREIEPPRETPPVIQTPPQDDDRRSKAQQLREALREGVQVVSAPQLFATPASTAGRMADEADIQPGDHVGEFSAGTGRILTAVSEVIDFSDIQVTAVEINSSLARALTERYPAARVICADFMACGDELGRFDKIIINPPFANGQDIAHISRALDFLKPGGRLVAICANGPRQQEKLRPLVQTHGGLWEELPEGTFEESGTRVRTVLLTIDL
jgi:protein-L-isoaspartate O-methyltransferase